MKRNVTGNLVPTEITQSGCKVTKDLFDTQIVEGIIHELSPLYRDYSAYFLIFGG